MTASDKLSITVPGPDVTTEIDAASDPSAAADGRAELLRERAPRPPEELVGALHDTVHREVVLEVRSKCWRCVPGP